MTVLDTIIEALENLGGKAIYSEIYEKYEAITEKPLTNGQRAGIRKAIEDHSSDSRNYKGKKDIFYSVSGLGSGEWGLRKYRF